MLIYINALKSFETRNWAYIEKTMREAYSDKLEFKDPIFHKHDLECVIRLYRKMIESSSKIIVDILDSQILGPDEFIVKLSLEYTHRCGLKFTIMNATSSVKVHEGKIVFRNDNWGLKNLRVWLAGQ